MIIEKRNNDLKDPFAIKHDKMKIILDWLLEFRFSTLSVLTKRLNQPLAHSSRFFNLLIKQGIIKEFRNQYFRDRLIMLTSHGAEFLDFLGRNVSRAQINTDNYSKSTLIFHHLEVQKSILKRIASNKFTEVIWDKNIKLKKQKERPDALLKSVNNYWIALEVERRRKEETRIFSSFYAHISAINKNQYDGVYYIFNFEYDYRHYKSLLNKNLWPRIVYDKHRKPKQTKEFFDPPQGLRDRFVLFLEPHQYLQKDTGTVLFGDLAKELY